MKILGISNPAYVGVRIATQAICSQYIPAAECTATAAISAKSEHLATAIMEACPDVLIVGGWCKWYRHLLERLKYARNFPVVCVGHGGPYHGKHFTDDLRERDVQHCLRYGLADWAAYVDPRVALYCQSVLRRLVLFLPHAVEPRPRVAQAEGFNVGLFGNAGFHKNTEGPAAIIRDYLARNPPGELKQCQGLHRSQREILGMIRACSVLVHVSHLEAYPNVVQEAWSMGIPVILSSACSGLARSPLLATEDREHLCALMLNDNIDASELYRALVTVREKWQVYSNEVYASYGRLSEHSRTYAASLLQRIVRGHRGHTYDLMFLCLEAPSV